MLCREVGGAHLSGGKVLSHEHALEARGVQAAAQHHVLRDLVHREQLPVVLAVRARLRVGLRKLAHLERRPAPYHHVGPCSHVSVGMRHHGFALYGRKPQAQL